MPANLPPQYLKAEEEFRRATTPAARLECLRTLFVLWTVGSVWLPTSVQWRVSVINRRTTILWIVFCAGLGVCGSDYCTAAAPFGKLLVIAPMPSESVTIMP